MKNVQDLIKIQLVFDERNCKISINVLSLQRNNINYNCYFFDALSDYSYK